MSHDERPAAGYDNSVRIGYARRTSRVEREIVLAIDQSGSMAPSIVYSSVFGAVLASLRSVSTRLVAFDTSVVDLTEQLTDPVDILFGVQLGGGTDINAAAIERRDIGAWAAERGIVTAHATQG